MNVINKIYRELQKDTRMLAIKVYPDKEVVFYLYETEIPIIVDLNKGYCYFESDMSSFQLDTGLMLELYLIMSIIDKNIDEIREWLSDKEKN